MKSYYGVLLRAYDQHEVCQSLVLRLAMRLANVHSQIDAGMESGRSFERFTTGRPAEAERIARVSYVETMTPRLIDSCREGGAYKICYYPC